MRTNENKRSTESIRISPPNLKKNNTSLSFSKIPNQPRVYQVPIVPKYIKINRPLINNQQRNKIIKKLQVDHKANKRAQMRQMNNNLLIRYSYNPFSDLNSHIRSQSKSPINQKSNEDRNLQRQIHNQSINIIDAINPSQNLRSNHHELKIPKRSHTTITLLSSQKSKKLIHFQQKKVIKSFQEKKKENKDLTLNQILSLKDQNFFISRSKPKNMNIFQYLKAQHKKFSNQNILKKYYFNFTHCIENTQKFKISTFRDLSNFGRGLINDTKIPNSIKFQILQGNELTLNFSNISFVDLLSAASGRMDPTFAYNILYKINYEQQNTLNSSISEDEQLKTTNNENLKQKKTNIVSRFTINESDLEYLKGKLSPQQLNQHLKYKEIHQKIGQYLQKMDESIQHQIQDKRVLNKYEILINENLANLVNMSTSGANSNQKKIRQKSKINQLQKLKIEELLSCLRLKKKSEINFERLICKK